MVVFVNCKETLVLFFDETLLVDTIVGMAAVWGWGKSNFYDIDWPEFFMCEHLSSSIRERESLVLVPVESA